MTKQTTCFFTGHRDIPKQIESEIYYKICNRIDILYSIGYRHFITGGAVGFDTLCAKAVLEKRVEKDITLSVFVPCKDQDKNFSEQQKQEYQQILNMADNVNILSKNYFRGCMHARNRKMADASSVCVAYCTKKTGGSAYTTQYAEKHGVQVFYIY